MVIEWKKSSASNSQGNCLEMARQDAGIILIRESDEPNAIVATTPEKLAAFIEGVRRGDFDEFVL
jgi:hypothetical protein